MATALMAAAAAAIAAVLARRIDFTRESALPREASVAAALLKASIAHMEAKLAFSTASFASLAVAEAEEAVEAEEAAEAVEAGVLGCVDIFCGW